jgi:hypothetical protein
VTSTSTDCCMVEDICCFKLERSVYNQCVILYWCDQSVISSIQNVLVTPLQLES